MARIKMAYIGGGSTRGPGGFFMALRSIHALRQITADMEIACRNACYLSHIQPSAEKE